MIVLMCDFAECEAYVRPSQRPTQTLGWGRANGSLLCPEHASKGPWHALWESEKQRADKAEAALDTIWTIVRNYDRSPNVAVRVLEVLEGLG